MLKTKKLFAILFILLINPLFVSILESKELKYWPLIIGHRGACGYRPEHTKESYQLAIDMGADYIEPDVVMTKDGVLVARHENDITQTTDVELKFPHRKATKIVDGVSITGYFTEDFTLQELKTLKAKERLEIRNHEYDGKFDLLTLEEVIKLALSQKRKVGLYIETKHPTYFKKLGIPLERPLADLLKKYKLHKKNSMVFIQSFELSNLKELKRLVDTKLIYLIDEPEMIPFDHVERGDKRTYAQMLENEGLVEISKIAYGIGPYKRYIVKANENNQSTGISDLVTRAHNIGLEVHPFTFRNDAKYLLKNYEGDPIKEYWQFFELKVDGVFSDFADTAIKARSNFRK